MRSPIWKCGAKHLTHEQQTQRLDSQHQIPVTFIKRSTGELRTLNAQLGVTRHTSGDPDAFMRKLEIDLENNLITVFSPKIGYRSVPLDGIVSFKCGNTAYTSTNTKDLT